MILPDIKKVVVILSGGLDSTILTYALVEKYGAENVQALSFWYGQKQARELYLADKTCKKLNIFHKIINLDFLYDIAKPISANIMGSDIEMPKIQDVLGDPQPVTEVPYRNMLMTTIAFSYAQANKFEGVFTGIQVHDQYGYWDCTEEYIMNMNSISALNRQHNIQLYAPFARMSKKDELAIGQLLEVDYKDTLTCYNPDDAYRSCGVCPSCSERIQTFMLAGLKDPIEYQVDIPWET